MTEKRMLPKEDLQLIGSQLRYIRKTFGMTMQQVADETCLSLFTIVNAEKGHSVSRATCNHLLFFYLCILNTYSKQIIEIPSFDLETLQDAFTTIKTTLFRSNDTTTKE